MEAQQAPSTAHVSEPIVHENEKSAVGSNLETRVHSHHYHQLAGLVDDGSSGRLIAFFRDLACFESRQCQRCRTGKCTTGVDARDW